MKVKTPLQLVIEVECARHGWSLRHFARRLGMLPQTLNAYLNRGNPRMETLQQFAQVLDVPVVQLLRIVTPEEFAAAHGMDQTTTAAAPTS
jgi:transcriptional regulator with XRE-family HTH domain